jgi:hypothetical protein
MVVKLRAEDVMSANPFESGRCTCTLQRSDELRGRCGDCVLGCMRSLHKDWSEAPGPVLHRLDTFS